MHKSKRKTFRTAPKTVAAKVGNIKKIEKAVMETLSYRAVFEYPLSFYQLSHFLITRKRVLPEDLKKALDYLLRTRKISEKDGKYYLFRTKTVDWDVKKRTSEKLITKAQSIIKILKKLPWIQFVGITGAIAAFNAPKNDDIDLLIITRKNRLWITRGFIFLILKILGELRTDKNPDQKICPNILMDESKLSWNKHKRNLYVAHELMMMYPLLDRNNTYFRIIKDNEWVFKYFGNLSVAIPENSNFKEKRNPLMNYLEIFAMKMQIKYMAKKKTNEVTNSHLIHFNRDDSTNPILTEFQKIYQKAK